ncbi:MAG: hypothetical protein K0V04_24725 [Deltaproteobacteria bacterium]|nr:hypothetical protein [Deltaproteobacteria bacterium]
MTDDDEFLVAFLAIAIDAVGIGAAIEAPLVTYDERCFPDPWQPTLVGVRDALRRMMVHLGMRDVPVRLSDLRNDLPTEGLVHEPVIFEGIEHGAACFEVHAVGRPEAMASWLALESVRAWAEYQGVTRSEALAYRVEPVADVPTRHRLDEGSATALAVVLGLGPVVAGGTIQTHVETTLASVGTRFESQTVGGLPPMAIARLLAFHTLVRAASEEERAQVRDALPLDMRKEHDAALDEYRDRAVVLREAVRLPPQPASGRRPLDLRPLPPVDGAELVQAERELPGRVRAFNRGRRVFRVVRRRTVIGVALGLVVGMVVFGLGSLGTALAMGGFVAAVLGGYVGGRSSRFYECADPDCSHRLSISHTTCPGCGGTVAGEIESAKHRLEAEERLEAVELATTPGAPTARDR